MPKKRKPSYGLHKATGQARVWINGQDHYLGPYGSPESRDRYDDLIAEWFRQERRREGAHDDRGGFGAALHAAR